MSRRDFIRNLSAVSALLFARVASAYQKSLPNRRIHHQPAAAGGGGASISVDDSVIRWTGTPVNNTDITSASFTPANNSLLVCCISADTNGGANNTMSVSGGSLTWTARVERNGAEGSGGGYSGIFTAPVGTGASMTVNVRRTAGVGGSHRISAKVYIVTNQNASAPIGTSNEGSSTTNNLSAAAYTSTVNNSRGFGAATDWNALGAGTTDPASTDTKDSKSYSGEIDAISAYKASNTTPSGTAVTLNFDAAGTSAAAWNWCALEIVP